MAKTKQRMLLYDFSARPVLPLNVKLFTKGQHRVGNVTLLRGKTVSVPKGSFYQRVIEDFGGYNVKLYRNELDALKALAADEVEVFCGGDKTAYYYIRKLHMQDISAVGTPIRVTQMFLAVNKDHKDVLDLVNNGLRRIMENGEYDRIYRKWFVQELAPGEREKLIAAARDIRVNAYAPYTRQTDGAAVLTQSGRIYTGVTIENALPNLTTSALKVAAMKAVSDGETELRAAVVVSANGDIVPPSADERQVLFEFGRGVLAVTEPVKGTFVDHMVSDLLPFAQAAAPRDDGNI
jgi:cytidine deaminase